MLCQICGKHLATTHIKSIVNGTLVEMNLCSACAKEKGYNNFFSDFGLELGNLFGDWMSAESQKQTRCPNCGASFGEISQSGKVGCGMCYTVFRDRLMPTIRKVHGTAKHKGKHPGSSAMCVVPPAALVPVKPEKSLLEQKNEAMQQAIQAQDFEQAAILRDEIRALKKESEDNG